MKLPTPLLSVCFKSTDEGHLYSVDGRDTYYPGVTTILSSCIAKRALVPWAAKLTAKKFREKVEWLVDKDTRPSVEHFQRITVLDLDYWEKEAAKAPFAERDKAGEMGTDVHSQIDLFLTEGQKPSDSPSFDNFLKWYEKSGLTFLAGDTPVVSLGMGYGGRPDALFVDENQRIVLVDIKTGKGVYGEAFIQMGGYAEALMETYGIIPHRMIVLHVRPEQTKVYECHNPFLARKAWKSVKTLYDDLKEINTLMEAVK